MPAERERAGDLAEQPRPVAGDDEQFARAARGRLRRRPSGPRCARAAARRCGSAVQRAPARGPGSSPAACGTRTGRRRRRARRRAGRGPARTRSVSRAASSSPMSPRSSTRCDPGDQLVQQGPPPRGPRRGPGRERVSLGQEVRGRGDVRAFPRVAATSRIRSSSVRSRRVAVSGQEQVLRDHERSRARGRGPSMPIAASCSARSRRRAARVALADLADVVQQRSQQQGVGPLDLATAGARSDHPHPRSGEQLGHPAAAPQMRVDGEPMVRVALGPASDARPAGRNRCSRPTRSSTSSIATPSRPRRSSERNASRTAGVPGDGVGDVGVRDRVEGRGRRDRAALGRRRPARAGHVAPHPR